MDVSQWVPGNCKLFVTFDPGLGWGGSLRLRNDYLGYLVNTRDGATPEAAIAAVHAAFMAGRENPDGLDVARATYFRQITPPIPMRAESGR